MHPNRRAGLACALSLIGLVACSSPPKLQPLPLTFGGVGGNTVNAIARGADGTTYFGGNFTSVSVTTGAGLALDGASGLPKQGIPRVEGEVKAVLADGKGGWYLGGVFRSVGGQACQNLAHLTADSAVDPAWVPKVDGPVYALALRGGMVLVGGDFDHVGSEARQNLAEIDVSGSATAWDPKPSGPLVDDGLGNTVDQARVNALAVSGTSIYVGGVFTSIGGSARTNLAAVDTDAIAVDWVEDANGPVRALLATATNLYVGGEFTSIGLAQGLNGLASFTLNQRLLVETWKPGLTIGSGAGKVYALAAISKTLYVGGEFTGFGTGGGGGGGSGTGTRFGVAAIDESGVVVPEWNPALGLGGDASAVVYALTASDKTVYLGGNFTSIGGTTRNFGAAVDGTSGVFTAWDPSFDGSVQALAARGDTVFAGGAFLGLSAVQRNRLAAIAPDGTLANWGPNIPTGSVHALAVDGDTVYVGGQFQSIGGLGRLNLAAVDKLGVVQAWSPAVSGSTPSDTKVEAIGVGSDAIYFGGAFQMVGDQARSNLASVDRAGGLTSWYPSGMEGIVNKLLVSGGDVICAGVTASRGAEGPYAVVGYIPSQDTTPLSAPLWQISLKGATASAMELASLAVTGDDGKPAVRRTLLVGGAFTSVDALAQANLVTIDVDRRQAGSILVVPAFDGPVSAIAIADGTVYVAGTFQNATGWNAVDSKARAGMAAFNEATGALTEWQPDVYAPVDSDWIATEAIAGLVPVPGGIQIAGSFTSVDSKIGSGLARVGR